MSLGTSLPFSLLAKTTTPFPFAPRPNVQLQPCSVPLTSEELWFLMRAIGSPLRLGGGVPAGTCRVSRYSSEMAPSRHFAIVAIENARGPGLTPTTQVQFPAATLGKC